MPQTFQNFHPQLSRPIRTKKEKNFYKFLCTNLIIEYTGQELTQEQQQESDEFFKYKTFEELNEFLEFKNELFKEIKMAYYQENPQIWENNKNKEDFTI